MYTYFLRGSTGSQALVCYPPCSHLVWEKSDLFTCQCSASCASLTARWRTKDCSENDISSSEFESKEPWGGKEVFCLHRMPTPMPLSSWYRNIKSSREDCFQCYCFSITFMNLTLKSMSATLRSHTILSRHYWRPV